MERKLSGTIILIVQGSLLAGPELQDAFDRSGARVCLTTSVINAFNLLQRTRIDGAVVDQGLHNAAFELCSELQHMKIPYICCSAPHHLQKPASRMEEAVYAAWRLAEIISARSTVPAGYVERSVKAA